MITLAYKLEFKNAKYGMNVTNTVYRIKNNVPVKIGVAYYNTGSFRGHNHEAVRVAVNEGKLPKKFLDGSKTQYLNHDELGKSFQLFEL